MHICSRRRWLEAAFAGSGALVVLRGASSETVSTEMVRIPGGPFLMGTTEAEATALAREHGHHPSWLAGELPQRQVDVAAFQIDRFPVTNAAYARFVAATGHQPPLHWGAHRPPERLLDHPVTMVDHADATAFARWAGKRLPTEAEWEKAARGENGLRYPWGDRFDPQACHFDAGGDPVKTPSSVPHHLLEEAGRNTRELPGGTCPVDAHPRGASPYGVMDLVGNAAEWCADSPGPGSAIVKGGCWLTTSPLNLRPAGRTMSGFANNKLAFVGFRCVQEVRS